MPLIPDIQPLDGAYRPSVASPQAAGAPGQAAANLGRDVQQSAGVLVEIHGKYQAARDNGAKNAARLMIQQAQAEHAQFRLQNPDESTWGADIEGRLGKARESIFQQDMSPFMRTEMEATFAGWQQEASSATMLDATKQGVTRARQRSTNAVRAYKDAGDFESARRVVAESRDANVWLPEEAEADLLDIDDEEREFGKKKTAEQYQIMADSDPGAVIDILKSKNLEGEGFANDPDMEDGTRFRLIKQAESRLEELKRDEYEAIQQGISEGRVTEAEIESLPQFLADPDKRALKAHFNRVTPPTAEEYQASWGKLDKLRAAYRDGEVPDADYLKAYREARMDILATVPPDYDGDLLQGLSHLSPANRKNPGNPETLNRDTKRDLEMEAASTFTAAFESGFYGKIDGTPAEKEAAARKFRDDKRAAAAWIQQQKGVTVDQVRLFADERLSTSRAGSAATELRSFMPGAGRSLLPPTRSTGRQKAADEDATLNPGPAGMDPVLLPPREQLDDFLSR
jgi:hypothetical protein